MPCPIKKLEEMTAGVIFIASAYFLFYKQQFGLGAGLLLALLPLLKLDKLTELAFGKDWLRTKFENPGPESRTITPSSAIIAENNVALVSYKVANQLSDTVRFNFIEDRKVWFWIGNYGPRKYKAYVKIKFIADNFEKEVLDGYYGGTQAWKLNAFSGIQAPGLDIPEALKNIAKEGRKIKIQISCAVKDENDSLIEEKLPQTYVYDPTNNSWFLEP